MYHMIITEQIWVISDVMSKNSVSGVFCFNFYHQVGIFLHQVVGNPARKFLLICLKYATACKIKRIKRILDQSNFWKESLWMKDHLTLRLQSL